MCEEKGHVMDLPSAIGPGVGNFPNEQTGPGFQIDGLHDLWQFAHWFS